MSTQNNKEMNKMKKTTIILSLLFTILIPKASYSQNNPIRDNSSLKLQGFKLLANSIELYDIKDALKNMTLATEEEQIKISVLQSIGQIQLVCYYEAELLNLLMNIKEEHKPAHYENRKETMLKLSKEVLLNNLGFLNLAYGLTIHPPLLDQINKGREIVRSSLRLLDKSIELLQKATPSY